MTALQVSLPQPRSFTGQLPTLSIGSESRVPVNSELGGLQTQFDGSSLFSISLEAAVKRLVHIDALFSQRITPNFILLSIF